MPSYLEVRFASLWEYYYPDIDLHSEYRFSPPRRYRWDFCHPQTKIAIEIQGGIWAAKGGHTGGTGLLSDYEKFCFAAALGWRVFPLADSMIDEKHLHLIASAIRVVSVQRPKTASTPMDGGIPPSVQLKNDLLPEDRYFMPRLH